MAVIEEVDYDVTLTIRLHTTVRFAPMERDSEVTQFDAIANAWGSSLLPDEFIKDIESEGEYEVSTDTEAHCTYREAGAHLLA
jgi:hypothetical protein